VSFSFLVPLYARDVGLEAVGKVFMVASISIAVARLVFGRAPDALGPIRSSTIALLLTAAGATVLALWHSVPGIYVSAAILAGGMALQTPSMIPVAVHRVEPRDRASAMATFTMFMDLSVALTGPIMGALAGGAGYRVAFLAGGGCSLVALVIVHTVLAPRWSAANEPEVQEATSPRWAS
jgi:MFS family permease